MSSPPLATAAAFFFLLIACADAEPGIAPLAVLTIVPGLLQVVQAMEDKGGLRSVVRDSSSAIEHRFRAP